MAEPKSEAAFHAQLEAARKRAGHSDATEPRAASARYDADARLVVVELTNRCTFGFPPEVVPELAGLSAQALAEVRPTSRGRALTWDGADVDVDVPGLIAHAVNLAAWAPKYLGSRTSDAKARASRENGRKGGRPRRKVA